MNIQNVQGIQTNKNGATDKGYRTYYIGRYQATANAENMLIRFTTATTHPVLFFSIHAFMQAARGAAPTIESYGTEYFANYHANTNSGWASNHSWIRQTHGNGIVSFGFDTWFGNGYDLGFRTAACSTSHYSDVYLTAYCNDWDYITVTYP